MIDHLSIQCHDLSASAAFYDAVLATIGGRRLIDRGSPIGYGVDFPTFWLGTLETGDVNREVHIAFTARSRDSVRMFRDVALALGAELLHDARVWPEYHDGYYGVFLRDPDGNNIEAVHHTFVQHG